LSTTSEIAFVFFCATMLVRKVTTATSWLAFPPEGSSPGWLAGWLAGLAGSLVGLAVLGALCLVLWFCSVACAVSVCCYTAKSGRPPGSPSAPSQLLLWNHNAYNASSCPLLPAPACL
jgi:hypothetical protein